MTMIRKAKQREITAILRIYEIARCYMRQNGNPTQWGDDYPSFAQIADDIAAEWLYVLCDDRDHPYGVFAFILGGDPNYAQIDGAWLNDRPYGTIHRIAGDGSQKGVFSQSLEFCEKICPNIRIDTHLHNTTMRHLLKKNGFIPCGMVNLEGRDGDGLRIAYQKEG